MVGKGTRPRHASLIASTVELRSLSSKLENGASVILSVAQPLPGDRKQHSGAAGADRGASSATVAMTACPTRYAFPIHQAAHRAQ